MYLQSLGLDIGTPLRVNADGICLFKSISTLLYGHEDRARELRVRICIQMCNNMDRYLSSPDAGNILLLSPTFEDACRDCATDSAWSSVWSIMALADVIGHSIKTHYPPMYGKRTFGLPDPQHHLLAMWSWSWTHHSHYVDKHSMGSKGSMEP